MTPTDTRKPLRRQAWLWALVAGIVLVAGVMLTYQFAPTRPSCADDPAMPSAVRAICQGWESQRPTP